MAARHPRKESKLRLESLENREMMNADWGTIGPQTLSQPAALTLLPQIDDRFEANDSRAQAAQLGPISTQQTFSDLRMADSQDWYRFRLNDTAGANAAVQLSFLHSQGDVDVRLYNGAGQEIGSSTGIGNSERISLAGLAAGEYFVKVYGYLGVHNPNYSMTIDPAVQDDRFENNDSRTQAAQLGTLAASQTFANLRMNDSEDWYRFRIQGTAGADAAVQLSFLHGQGDVDVRVYNSAGQQVGASTGVGNSERVSLAGLQSGEYFVKVYGYNGAHNPNYSMTINPAQNVIQTLDDHFENNDSRVQAASLGTLTSEQTYSNLRMADSQDWYRFRITTEAGAGAAVQVNFQHAQGDIDVRLYNAAGQEIGASTGIGNSERISLAGRAAGEYFVKVYGYNGAQNPEYSLVINPAQDDRMDGNDTRALATNLGAVNSPRTIGNLRMVDGQDWYRFSLGATAGGNAALDLSFLHSQGDIDVRLYTAGGNLMRSSTGVGNSEHISLAGLAAGEYFIEVYGYNGAQNPNYSMTINPGRSRLISPLAADAFFSELGAEENGLRV